MKVKGAEKEYMAITHRRYEMEGKGAPRDTVFGVIGATKMVPEMELLGGLVHNTKASGKMPPVMKEKMAPQTDRHIVGPASKTHYPGEHYSQVPFVGAFSSHLGHRL
jgi:hypothetical protein